MSGKASRIIQGKFAASHGFGRPAGPAARNGGPRVTAVPPNRLFLPATPGKPLPEALQRKMGAALGGDFSNVRVHVGPQASSIGALAFTTGSDIYFAPGQYRPDTPQGQQLLGHELAHVLQQKAGRVRVAVPDGLSIVQDDALEAEADRLGQRAAAAMASPAPQATPFSAHPFSGPPFSGRPFGVAEANRGALQRKAAPMPRPNPPPVPAGGPMGRAGAPSFRPPARVLQRMQQVTLANKTITAPKNSTDYKNSNTFFTEFQNSTQQAYNFILSAPQLGPYKDLDGHTKKWVSDWNDYNSGKVVKTLATSFGYAIESLATSTDSQFYPTNLPKQTTVYEQLPVGSTRPDLVLSNTKTGNFIAFGDLTASKSADHIFLKDNWKAKVANFTEIVYPSLEPANYMTMSANHNNTGMLSTTKIIKKLNAARKKYEKQRARWKAAGKRFWFSILRDEVRQEVGDLSLNDDKIRDFIRRRLQQYFDAKGRGVVVPDKLVPSILKAMGVPSTPWRYTLGYGESLKAGEKFLMNNF
ncbi:eCIS core domain-containing protein [Azospirillum agricola]|uniref:eCIS core domain-containing protein n=1 Tax=Azospirillum agricola TaxID=1720247 RepID=UPI000A0F39EE|nr:DUF4157 domain-containing protein [Azospirillum agricola]SMH39825.1 protein of unknown function [Azospirillum lipoferum]